MTGDVGILDCDVHLPPPTPPELLQYLPAHWSEYFGGGAFGGTSLQLSSIYPPGAPTTSSEEARATLGGQPGITLVGVHAKAEGVARGGSYLDLLRRRVLDLPDVEGAIANCYTALEGLRHPYLAPDLARATNDWVVAEWLDREPRLYGSAVVPVQFPEAAAREIERVAGDSRFVQVLIPARSLEPYGARRYWPIFQAASKHGLVVAIHFGGIVGIPPTSSGWPSYYLEEYVGMAHVFQTQVTSLAISGVLVEYPDLRISLCEGGFSWMPTVMWQLDKRWKGLRRDVPWVRKEPSDYIREHMRATIQPADLPPSREQLLNLIEFIGATDFLIYASDFPHVHATSPAELLELLPDEVQPKVRSLNARAFFPRLHVPAPA